MKPSLIEKLAAARSRFDEVNRLLMLPETLGDQSKIRALGRERTQLQAIVAAFDRYCANQRELGNAEKMQHADDAGIKKSCSGRKPSA